MLRKRNRLLRQGLRFFDAFLAIPSFYAAYYLHIEIITPLFSSFFTGLYPIEIYTWILHYTIPFCLIIFHLSGLYKPFQMEPIKKIPLRIFWSIGILTLTEYTVIYVLLRRYYVSRFFIFLFMGVYLTLLIIFRILLFILLYRMRGRGFNDHQILVVGTGKTAREVYKEIEAHQFWAIRVLGFIAGAEHSLNVPGEKVIGELQDLEPILKKEVVDEVFVAFDEKELVDREEVFRTCERVGVNTYLVPAHYEWQLAKSATTSLGKLNLIRFFTVPINPYLLAIKRSIDILVSSFVLIFFPFLYLVVGLLIKLDSPGPVFYRQTRVSHNKRQFYCYKFRTMLENADAQIELLDAIDETKGPIRKSRDDPRVTRVGRILRRFSIDEIPQFINIFKGEMSLVGPRPPTSDEVERYEFYQLRKLSVKQGLTGLWQVSGRDAIRSFDERLRLDLDYIDRWSLWMDLKIILKTIFIIFKKAS